MSIDIYYTVYKVTNQINGKSYIGKHIAKNPYDRYFGSGKAIKNAIKKYHKRNFIKEIISIYDKEWKMDLAERILVVVDKETSYNLTRGGEGGSHLGISNKGKKRTLEFKKKMSENTKNVSYNQRFGIQKSTELKELRRTKIYSGMFLSNLKYYHCSYCNKKIKGKGNYTRWHEEKCKFKVPMLKAG